MARIGRDIAAASGAVKRAAAAGPADEGLRLDLFLARALPDLSRSRLKQLILAGHVRIDGVAIADPAAKVRAGQRFEIAVPEAVEARPRAQAIPLDILYEDADLIVIDKPAGLVVHPAAGNPDRTLVNALIAHCGASLSGIGGERRPGIVHRLDKDTSGLMVAAKSDRAHRALTAQFAAHDIERAYRALVWGVPRAPQGEIVGNIGRSPRNRKKMAVLGQGGRPALTRYRLLAAYGDAASLLECRLLTGRTHQIRVHLASLGHPIMGDLVYGRSPAWRLASLPEAAASALTALGRQALDAYLLGFVHPESGAKLRFERESPSDFNRLRESLEAFSTKRRGL